MIWIPKTVWADQSLSGLPVGIAGDTALRIFCTPELSQYRAPNHRLLVERARFHLRNANWKRIPTPVGEIQTYTFEPDRGEVLGTILVSHGWTGEASFMTAIAEPIRRAGFRVVLFDFPAHGLSSENSTNLIDCARATAFVGHEYGPLYAIVAHSFGGLVSLVASEGAAPISRGLNVRRAVFVASPNRLSQVTADFSRHWGLSAAGQQAFEQRLERVGGRPIECFSIARLLNATGCEALVIHDRDDSDVSFRSAEEIVEDVEAAELIAFQGFGHRNILFAPPVMRMIVSYLVRAHA
ncbi:MAG: alpha/beta fold hydrolase [Hyphomicrobium sp.]|uniref:alpha/beta hydrolase n=1 Tax=Hyphomicrobium sp. TaxID=82 RepID=UPI0039E2BD3E